MILSSWRSCRCSLSDSDIYIYRKTASERYWGRFLYAGRQSLTGEARPPTSGVAEASAQGVGTARPSGRVSVQASARTNCGARRKCDRTLCYRGAPVGNRHMRSYYSRTKSKSEQSESSATADGLQPAKRRRSRYQDTSPQGDTSSRRKPCITTNEVSASLITANAVSDITCGGSSALSPNT